jgi:hypothetical protein
VGITEWDSLEKAEAFYKSKAWTDLAPQGDKAVKTVRRATSSKLPIRADFAAQGSATTDAWQQLGSIRLGRDNDGAKNGLLKSTLIRRCVTPWSWA